MPCDLGYKVIAKVTIPTPVPQDFKEEVKAPEIDADLLEKIGEDDPEFLAGINDLDTQSLFEAALERAQAALGGVR
jgi:hypothetical protein